MVSELLTGTERLILGWSQFSKGHNYLKNCRLTYCTSALHMMMLNICTKFHENISKSFRVIEQI